MNKCIIIGAGAIGLLSARLLAESGFEVKIIERGEVGKESSWAGGGILSPLYPWRYPDSINQLASYGQRHYPALLSQLHEESGIDPELLDSGMLLLDPAEPEIEDWAARWNHTVEQPSSAAELQKIQPGLSSQYESGTWLPNLQQLRNPRLMAALLKSTAALPNVTIVSHTPVTSLQVTSKQITGVATAEGTEQADTILVAAGAWSSGLLPKQPPETRQISPVKGQILQFQAPPDLVQCMIMENSRYLIPRKDGLILAGSTLEYTKFEKEVTQEARDQLYEFATGIIPALTELPIANQWAGLRPGTEQGIPLIGEHPEISGLFINAGHHRNGIITGLASCQLCRDLITGEDPVFDPTPYRITA